MRDYHLQLQKDRESDMVVSLASNSVTQYVFCFVHYRNLAKASQTIGLALKLDKSPDPVFCNRLPFKGQIDILLYTTQDVWSAMCLCDILPPQA